MKKEIKNSKKMMLGVKLIKNLNTNETPPSESCSFKNIQAHPF